MPLTRFYLSLTLLVTRSACPVTLVFPAGERAVYNDTNKSEIVLLTKIRSKKGIKKKRKERKILVRFIRSLKRTALWSVLLHATRIAILSSMWIAVVMG